MSDSDIEDLFEPDTGISRLASLKNTVTKAMSSFFVSLFGAEKTCMVGERLVNYIQLPDKNNMFDLDKIFVRSCYQHLTPHIQNSMNDTVVRRRVAITGTPGIGKTVYGALLTRMYILQKNLSVVYWERDNIYLFSWDEEKKNRFGLNPLAKIKGSVLYFGWWVHGTAPASFADLLNLTGAIVIHDPKQDFQDVALHVDYIERIVFVLSYGHSLIEHWKTKDRRPAKYFYLPLWTEQEGVAACLLWEKTLNQDEYKNFGGCIRGWLSAEMLSSLKEKAKDVVRKNGADVLGRTRDTKGSLIHMHVTFDESKPMQLVPPAGTFTSNAAASPNEFSDYSFGFGSPVISEFINDAILQAGAAALERCMQTWAAQAGFESVYGGLFELHCHHLLAGNRKPLTVRCRKVYKNDGDNTSAIFTVTLPVVEGISRYKSNDPSILGGDDYANDVKTSQYLWPLSSVHPTYDSALLVEGDVVGLPKDQMVPLLLQMTVSGASGLPRQPKHSVKQYVRRKFDEALRKHEESIAPGITTFVVPSECFEPFLFQFETVKDDDEKPLKSQPEYQLVLEIPDSSGLVANHNPLLEELLPVSGARKRVHRYRRALRGAPKRTNTEHSTD